MKTALTKIEQTFLRREGIIQQSEVAYLEGDLYIAEDVLSGEKRMITQAGTMLSENKSRVLHG